MLRIKKRLNGFRTYLYGFSAMMICSAAAIGSIAWTHSLKYQLAAVKPTKTADSHQTNANRSQSNARHSPSRESVSKGSDTEKPAVLSERSQNVSATPESSSRPASQPAESNLNPTPTPVISPTPTPTVTPPTEPTPSLEPLLP